MHACYYFNFLGLMLVSESWCKGSNALQSEIL